MRGDKKIPLITVAIPAYKHEKYVEESIRSVLAQDYPRIELIVVDDGSPDKTWEVVQSLNEECKSKCEHVVLSRNSNNQGTCFTCNRLRDLATGDFFLLMASDDKLLPGALFALVKPMLENEDIGVVVGQNQIMDGDGRICFWDKDQNNVYSEDAAKWKSFNEFLQDVTGINQFGPEFGTYSSFSKANHVANGYLIRKNILDKVLPFSKDAPLEDYWLHLQLSKITKYKAIPQSTFIYRWHENNTIKQKERMRQFWDATVLWESQHVEEIGREWASLFNGVELARKREWAIGRIICCYHVRSRIYKWHELRVCGQRFVFRKRSCSLAW